MNVVQVTVVAPVLQEEGSIGQLLDDLRNQSCAPSEIIIVDAGSTDRTREVVLERARFWPGLKCIVVEGALPGRGRNAGIAEAKNELVVLTDAGVRLPYRWLESLAAPLVDGTADVVFGGFAVEGRSALDLVIELLLSCEAVEWNGRPVYFPTTCSLAFCRQVWMEAGRFPETLRACEDSVFFGRLFELESIRPSVAPEAVIDWSMGGGLGYLSSKAFRSGRGEAMGGIVSRRTLMVIALLSIGGAALACFAWTSWKVTALVTLSLVVLLRVERLRRKNPRGFGAFARRAWAVPWLAITVPWADVCHLSGFLVGYCDRLRQGHAKLRVFRPVTVATPVARCLDL